MQDTSSFNDKSDNVIIIPEKDKLKEEININ